MPTPVSAPASVSAPAPTPVPVSAPVSAQAPAQAPAPAPAPAPSEPLYQEPTPWQAQQQYGAPATAYQAQMAPANAPAMAGMSAVPTAPAAPSQASIFWKWLLNSLKSPWARVDQAHPVWYALVAILGTAFMASLAATSVVYHVTTSIGNSVSSDSFSLFGTDFGTSSAVNNFANSNVAELFFSLFFALALFGYTIVLCVLLVHAMMGEKCSFIAAQARVAQVLIPALFLFAAAFVTFLLTPLSVLLIALGTLSVALSVPFLLLKIKNHRTIDDWWMWVFSYLVTIAFLVLAYLIGFVVIIGSFISTNL